MGDGVRREMWLSREVGRAVRVLEKQKLRNAIAPQLLFFV